MVGIGSLLSSAIDHMYGERFSDTMTAIVARQTRISPKGIYSQEHRSWLR